MSGTKPPVAPSRLTLTVCLAAGLWLFAFVAPISNFWLKISISAALLAYLAFRSDAGLRGRIRFDLGAVGLGLAAAVALYLVFLAGRFISTLILPFAEHQIGGIYGLGDTTSHLIIAPLLFFVTGPAEEIYWRGFLQEHLMDRLGPAKGFLVATACYTGVHLWTLNLMLIGAAAVAGAFWGLMYLRFRNLGAQIISHSVWTAVIFTILPMR